ncbi:hypothetical protein B0A55_11113 [Friedmanniomyces simplex]|uniref:Uncharacterized protein n=1 Tax=Friedmanniomyces simplex TaxID=329884 RepID=A0A4U0WQL0_9PEZI|nr:hypothetical protein B0A55_11113 [Friedmanniomyces simplex]
MEDVFPTIRGNTGTKFHKGANTLFNNLVEFAPGITDAKVDGYDGARPIEIELAVRRDLNGYIIPSTRTDLPAAPNNLTEVKVPAGRADVLRRQAMYAGAVGARGMFELRNYGNETLVYNGNAYTLVPAYHAGMEHNYGIPRAESLRIVKCKIGAAGTPSEDAMYTLAPL